jgi:hypothetical protein
MEKTHKLWQSMINTDLSPSEFLELKTLGEIREQSLRQLVSTILRQELRAYSDIIKQKQSNRLPTSLDSASPKRQRGRPRVKDTRDVIDPQKIKEKPASMLDIIQDGDV